MPSPDHYFDMRVTGDIGFRDVPARAAFEDEGPAREGKVEGLVAGIQDSEEFRFRGFGGKVGGGGHFTFSGIALSFFIIVVGRILFRLSYAHILNRTFFISTAEENIRPSPDENKKAPG